MAITVTICDLCGSSEYTELHPGNLARGDHPAEEDFSSSRQRACHYPIVQCTHCKLVRALQRDDDSTLNSIYQQMVDSEFEAEWHNRRRTASSYLDWVSKYCRTPDELLDVGCSTGIFLSQAQSAGWNVRGVEPSRWAARIASQRLKGEVIDECRLDEAEYPVQTFSVITLWDVIEHLPSPTGTFIQLNRWLKPSGWLFLNTPDVSSLPARFMGAHWVLFLREHIWYFSPGTIGRMLEECGFRLVAVRHNMVRFSIRTILKRLSQYQNNHFARRSGSLAELSSLAQLSLRFPIGEMTVAARKKGN